MTVKRTLLIGAAVIVIGGGWAAGFAYYSSAQAQTAAVATPAPSAPPAPDASTAPAKPDKHAMLGEAMSAAATYLGVSTSDLKTQMQSGKSLADIANATPGKSRDGLITALSGIADPKVIAKLVDRTITPN